MFIEIKGIKRSFGEGESRVEVLKGIDLGSEFVPHGALKKLYELCGLDAQSIASYTREVLGR